MRAVGACLQDQQVGHTRLDALSLQCVGCAPAKQVGDATCLSDHEQPAHEPALLAGPLDASDLKLRLGLLVPAALIASPA